MHDDGVLARFLEAAYSMGYRHCAEGRPSLLPPGGRVAQVVDLHAWRRAMRVRSERQG